MSQRSESVDAGVDNTTSVPFPHLDNVSPAAPFGSAHRRTRFNTSVVLTAAIVIGILLRLAVVILAGNGMRTPWGGGGDTPSYVLLAQNLLNGKGYAYAGMPTALRAPGYPLILAAFLGMFPSHGLQASRWLQFLEGIGLALFCAGTARKLWGETAQQPALAVTLLFPTLVEMNGEILSEATAAFFAAMFLYMLVSYRVRPHWTWLIGSAGTIGFGSLVRFNFAALGLVGLVAICLSSYGSQRWKHPALFTLLSLLIVSPWLIRNWIVFDGAVLFSTHSGLDALEGMVTPQGRALPGDADNLRAAVGWVPPNDVETNSPSRLALGPEPALDKQCWRAAIAIAEYKGWRLILLVFRKISDFWLSTDQLLWTGAFPVWGQILRAGGVLEYWGFLGLAFWGFLKLRAANMPVAEILLLYAGLVTVVHLPFVMSTRLRMPLIYPLLAVLAGGGLAAFAYGILGENRTVWKRD